MVLPPFHAKHETKRSRRATDDDWKNQRAADGDDNADENKRSKMSMAVPHSRSFSTSSGSSGGGNNTDRRTDILVVGDGDELMNYDHRRQYENPTDISFDSHSTNSFGMNTENDSSYMIDLLDVQLAELNRPDGALIGPDEASM